MVGWFPSRVEIVWLVMAEARDPNSDMGGTCPWGLGAPECIGGAKWSANGMLPSFQIQIHNRS